jgi:hypothetical protein
MQSKSLLLAAAAILATGTAEAELKAYDVDARYRQEVFTALRNVLQNNVNPVEAKGEVAMLPTGQVLVDAPDDVQAQVAAVLDAIAEKAAAEPEKSAASPNTLLRYWVLFGIPGQPQAAAVPGVLEGVVRELQNVHGEMSFSVLDTASLSSSPNDQGHLETDTLEISQQLLPADDVLNATIFIEHEYQELTAKIALRRGEYTVLSESSVENDEGQKGLLAFVVNWPERP